MNRGLDSRLDGQGDRAWTRGFQLKESKRMITISL